MKLLNLSSKNYFFSVKLIQSLLFPAKKPNEYKYHVLEKHSLYRKLGCLSWKQLAVVSSLWSVALLDWHICTSFVVSGFLTNLAPLFSLHLIFKVQFSYLSHFKIGRLLTLLIETCRVRCHSYQATMGARCLLQCRAA